VRHAPAFILAAAIATAATPVPAAAASALPVAPSRIEAEYRISSAGVVVGRVRETFVREGERYRIESVTRSEGPLKIFLDDTVTLRSEGRVGPAGLVPLRFEQRRARDASRDIEATFDWPAALLRSSYRGEEHTESLPAGTQDRLSVMYQFMNVSTRANEVRVPMSNGRKVSLYAYRKVDEPLLATPAGEFATVHFERIVDTPNDGQAQLWLARERHNIPVRVVFVDSKGLKLDQQLVSLVTR
jgi:hypothetical protein